METGPASQSGLSTAEAQQRLKQFGPNILPGPRRRGLAPIILAVLRQPAFALLLAGALVYLLLGDGVEAAVLGVFATLSVSISIIQESRSEKVLETLRNLASPRALVLRDGKRQRIAGRDVVPGDVMILAEGDRVPADALLTGGDEIMADESLLTGEAMPVRKKISSPEPAWAPPGGEDLPFVFAGTLVVRGTAMASVTATGLKTEMGKIGQSLQAIELEQPQLQQQLKWLVRDFALAGLAVTGLVFLLQGLLRDSWLQAALGAIAVGMSILPEEIPLVLAVFMAMGAWRISRAGVLTRRAAAIETLGSATILCTDKTGTLTENHMRVALISTTHGAWRPGEILDPQSEGLLHAALAASAAIPTDPMDRAIHEAALQAELSLPATLLQSYGFRPDLAATTNIWEGEEQTAAIAYAKGAPETIAELCRLSPEARIRLMAQADRHAADGIRLLAVARVGLDWRDRATPKSQRDIPFTCLGLIGFADPLRQTVPGAVRQCRSAGIRVLMITGDYPVTARAIAAQAGIAADRVITGEQMERMDEAALGQAVAQCSVFARIGPQQKLRLVQALKQQGEIVAMTGDGVNDAPAMKAAHIGISMGGRGTDVAREASAMVLLQDDFASIAATVRLGRRIYDNLRKAIEYIVAVHIPIAGMALLPLLFGLPLILMPVQIALLEMVIDPACSIVFEAELEEPDVMRRPPRPAHMAVLPARAAIWAALQGLAALMVCAFCLFLGARLKLPDGELRALAFTSLVLVNLGLILVNRSFNASLRDAVWRPNPSLGVLAGLVLSILLLALYWPAARELFRFDALPLPLLSLCLGGAVILVMLLETAKRIDRRQSAAG